jgi:CRISPR-associated protein Cas2
MAAEHLYIVAYDIADQKRWRRVFRTMKGYGEWLQLSVFQCRMSKRRQAELVAALHELINHRADHVVMLDFGPADQVAPRFVSLGKEFEPLTREAVII